MEKYEPEFTRYLYEKTQVKYSLLISLSYRNSEASLFWAYELYYSGYDGFVLDWVRHIYKKCPTFSKHIISYFEQEYNNWLETKNECILGTIISTMCIWRPNRKFIIMYKSPRHKTVESSRNIPAYRLLATITGEYATDLCAIEWMENETGCTQSEVEDALLCKPTVGDWLYYCRKSPIWAERITKYNGRLNDKTRQIIFDDDYKLEEFYAQYGYEPDEQYIGARNVESDFVLDSVSDINICD